MITDNNFDDQKHCSCKKSKCLKLYCDCFSAGLYCGEACSCQECFNSLDYEDTVDETRQQIELRNPQAFSSKIHNEDRDHPVPIAGKHKKGCNCKKSMCMKRYCECYQANVGCTGECRCEGCKNVFGKKPEYNVGNQSTPSTPWTPLQHSGEKKSAAGLFDGCNYLPSPGYANCDMISGASNENFDMVSSDQQSYPYVESANHFTPPNTTHINARHPAFMSNVPPKTDWPDNSRANSNLSPMKSWPSSLVTPVSLFGGPKVNDSNKKPIDNIDKSTPNARTSTNSRVHHNTGSMTSDQ